VFRGGLQHPRVAALRTVDGYREGAFAPACDGRRFKLEMQVGVALRTPGLPAARLMNVPGDVAVGRRAHVDQTTAG
jgi:hypothetical protein